MLEPAHSHRLNHFLADLSERVRTLYKSQLMAFEAAVSDAAVREQQMKELISVHAERRKAFKEQLFRVLGTAAPKSVDLAIRHEGLRSRYWADFSESSADFYLTGWPFRLHSGKAIFDALANMILYESGFYARRPRNHAAYVNNYTGRAEIVGGMWSKCGFGSVIVPPDHQVTELIYRTLTSEPFLP